MRVLMPDLPEFRALTVEGVTPLPYRNGEVPDGEAEGVVLWGANAETRSHLFARPGLRWVLTLTAGIDHVQGQLPPGVALYNASPLHARAVAVHTLAGMLAAARGLHRFRDAQRQGQWQPRRDLSTLDGASVVVWGHGHIGRMLEDLLTPHGAHVTGLRSATPPAERDAALAGADWVVLLLPDTPQTRGIVNADALARLKPGAWLSNQGRGSLVDTDALLAALDSGHLGGAVLDVTDPEPLPPGHPLWARENVLITPHIASTTADLTARGAGYTRAFLEELAAGREPEGRVETSKGY
ncbi:phosphoglycerate dehydrogenase-like enzyme [Deinococcus sp. HSC-46F16]|uniref:D-2-hydroxyacid dehydrogenase n=1 Tax=Deinococcus sp. HSC-46F16 TaxID=2910968 RepID=UPI00209C8400|nr:D-2-hydroxyacid dehydrogenase [Deinococcus sp. HSC-46F16]MCP2013334.1 phosphoglycerate dehydrogenase-like enzyme [Deinococcus sp. HSC-46F16]